MCLGIRNRTGERNDCLSHKIMCARTIDLEKNGEVEAAAERWHTSLEPPQLRQHFRRLQQRGYDSHNSTSSSSSSSSSDSDDDMDGTNLHTTNATGNNQAKKERASDGGESDDP